MDLIWVSPPSDKSDFGGSKRNRVYFEILKRNEKVEKLLLPGGFLPDIHFLFWLFRFMKKKKHDVIFFENYTGRYKLFIFNWLIKVFWENTQFVLIINSIYYTYRKNHIKNIIDKIISFFFFLSVDVAITSSKDLSKIISNAVKPYRKYIKTFSIYPGFRKDFFNFHRNKYLPEKNNVLQILCVCRFHPTKGLEYLIEAISSLPAVIKEKIKLTIVGREDAINYSKMIKDKVRKYNLEDTISFRDEIREVSRLMAFYKESDIFVLPSLYESSAACLVEAMFAGLPIIATDVGGVHEFIKDGENGILIPSKDSQSLAKAVSSLIKNADMREKMGEESFKKSFQFLGRTWDVVAEEFYEVWLEIKNLNREREKIEGMPSP